MKKFSHFLNLARIYKHYISRKSQLSYMPLKLWVEISSRCNLKCGMCMNRDLAPGQKGDMDYGLFRKIIDQASPHVRNVNLFHRGEPMMHPRLVQMIEYAKKAGMKTSIHTNATLLTGELSREIIRSGLDFISFSFDGYTRETYESNRTGADFEKTLGNIIGFLKQKKKSGRKLPYTVIQVMESGNGKNIKTQTGTPTKDSTDNTATGASMGIKAERKAFLSNFSGLPLDRLVVRIPHNWGGLLEDRRSVSRPSGLCTFPWYCLTIFYDGKVSICPQDFMGKIIIGDINRDSLKNIFSCKKAGKIRKEMVSGIFYREAPCRDCDRIKRNTFLGIPVGNLGAFIKENLGR